MRVSAVVVCLVLAVAGLYADERRADARRPETVKAPQRDGSSLTPGDKPAWEWTTEERLARRFDPISILDRFERATAEGLMGRQQSEQSGSGPKVQRSAESRPIGNVVLGSHNPELFFPFELFPYLVRAGFAGDESERQQNRERFAPLIAEFSEPGQFWRALEVAVEPYLVNQREEENLGAKLDGATSQEQREVIRREIATTQAPQCALRQEALAAAVKSIGLKNIYRLLYEGVAPGLSTIAREGELDPSRIKFIAGGCK